MRNNAHCQTLEQLRDHFPEVLFQAIIQEVGTARLREASAFGLPITRYAPKARSAHQYRALVQELFPLLEKTGSGEPNPITLP